MRMRTDPANHAPTQVRFQNFLHATKTENIEWPAECPHTSGDDLCDIPFFNVGLLEREISCLLPIESLRLCSTIKKMRVTENKQTISLSKCIETYAIFNAVKMHATPVLF